MDTTIGFAKRGRIKRAVKALGGFTLALVVASLPAASQSYATVDFPGAVANLATDINDSGQVVGEYTFTDLNHRQGFLFSDGGFTSITFPGASFTRALSINRYGDIVGDYGKPNSGAGTDFGYLLHNGAFTPILFPNSDSTVPAGINDEGDIVGWYFDKVGMHGFFLSGGTYTSIDFPGAAAYTQAWKINDAGEIAGRYKGATDGKFHMFVLSEGNFTPISDLPGVFETAVWEDGGLNGGGQIVSQYCSLKPCKPFTSVGTLHGFSFTNGVYTTFDYPNAIETLALGINSIGDIVGGYEDPSGIFHAYIRTP